MLQLKSRVHTINVGNNLELRNSIIKGDIYISKGESFEFNNIKIGSNNKSCSEYDTKKLSEY